MGHKQIPQLVLCYQGVSHPLPSLVGLQLFDVYVEPVQVEHPLVTHTRPEHNGAHLLTQGIKEPTLLTLGLSCFTT